jgi:hypothetical protein
MKGFRVPVIGPEGAVCSGVGPELINPDPYYSKSDQIQKSV